MNKTDIGWANWPLTLPTPMRWLLLLFPVAAYIAITVPLHIEFVHIALYYFLYVVYALWVGNATESLAVLLIILAVVSLGEKGAFSDIVLYVGFVVYIMAQYVLVQGLRRSRRVEVDEKGGV